MFKELGLEDEEIKHLGEGEKEKPLAASPSGPLHGGSKSDSIRNERTQAQQKLRKERGEKEKYTSGLELVDERKPWYSKLTSSRRPTIRSASSAPTGLATLPRVAMIAFLLAIVIPGLLPRGPHGVPVDGANAGVVKSRGGDAGGVWKREYSKTDTCTRWSHQAALLNGTLYIYGGQSKEKVGQEENTWSSPTPSLFLFHSQKHKLTANRFQLPHSRLVEIMGKNIPSPHRPSKTKRPSSSSKRFPLELLHESLPLRWSLLRNTTTNTRPSIDLGIQHPPVKMD